jgi:hypothetical protein
MQRVDAEHVIDVAVAVVVDPVPESRAGCATLAERSTVEVTPVSMLATTRARRHRVLDSPPALIF